MIIGLDFDNTIVCYDKAIDILASEYLRTPRGLPATKLDIRNYLKANDREADWTRFQGLLYGPGMVYAELYDGARDVISELRHAGHEIRVISHRTRFPYLGEKYDLHYYARAWIDDQISEIKEEVTFHHSSAQKLKTITEARCAFFLDDLPQVLTDSMFPAFTVGVLFSPCGLNTSWEGHQIDSWRELNCLVVSDG